MGVSSHLQSNKKFYDIYTVTIVIPWAVGDYCISLKVLKSPHKEIYSFKLTMLWPSFFSSLSSAKYFHLCSMHTTTVAMWAPALCCIDSTHAHVVLGIPNPFSFAFGDFPEEPEPHIEAQSPEHYMRMRRINATWRWCPHGHRCGVHTA